MAASEPKSCILRLGEEKKLADLQKWIQTLLKKHGSLRLGRPIARAVWEELNEGSEETK